MEKLDLSNKGLRKFGITMAVACGVITVLVSLKHHAFCIPAAVTAGIFLVLGVCVPVALKPFYVAWMKIAFVLGWVNTRILLTLMFYLVFTPIGFVMRLLGKDLLDRKLESAKDSYWRPCEKKEVNKEDYERQF